MVDKNSGFCAWKSEILKEHCTKQQASNYKCIYVQKDTCWGKKGHIGSQRQTRSECALWVAVGWLTLPPLEGGDNKLTIFKTYREQERWLMGRKKEIHHIKAERGGGKMKE